MIVKNQTTTPPKTTLAKKGCISSENKSSAGTRRKKNEVNDYVSPVKKNQGTKPKVKKQNMAKRTANLKTNRSKENLSKYKKFGAQRLNQSATKSSLFRNSTMSSEKFMPSKDYRRREEVCKSYSDLTIQPFEDHSKLNMNDNTVAFDGQLQPLNERPEEGHFSETTEEMEDPLTVRRKYEPSLTVYDKRVHGGMLYAFLDLQKCPKPNDPPFNPIQKAESYNEVDSNFQAYQKAIVNVGLTGIQRHSSTQLSPSKAATSLSEEDYLRIMELKNKRMNEIFKRR